MDMLMFGLICHDHKLWNLILTWIDIKNVYHVLHLHLHFLSYILSGHLLPDSEAVLWVERRTGRTLERIGELRHVWEHCVHSPWGREVAIFALKEIFLWVLVFLSFMVSCNVTHICQFHLKVDCLDSLGIFRGLLGSLVSSDGPDYLCTSKRSSQAEKLQCLNSMTKWKSSKHPKKLIRSEVEAWNALLL